MANSNFVVIMAGGAGTRFWPLSKSEYPKQFQDILGTGQTLLQQTFHRYKSIVPLKNIFVLTSDEHINIVCEQLPLLQKENVLGEPCRKNTAPSIAYIASKLYKKDPNAVIIVTPSDHLILIEKAFTSVCKKSIEYVKENDSLLTIGITPTNPNTSYGYIKRQWEQVVPSIYKVLEFTEKPNQKIANQFFSSGDYLWNSGILISKASVIIESLKKHKINIYNDFFEIFEFYNTHLEKIKVDEAFRKTEEISIDYAILEKADNNYLMHASFEWSDLGTWSSAWEKMEKDQNSNAISGNNIMVFETSNCIIQSENKKTLLIQGLQNFIVIDSKDALLICSMVNEKEIKYYLNKMEDNLR